MREVVCRVDFQDSQPRLGGCFRPAEFQETKTQGMKDKGGGRAFVERVEIGVPCARPVFLLTTGVGTVACGGPLGSFESFYGRCGDFDFEKQQLP